jgi:hypothetical protein
VHWPVIAREIRNEAVHERGLPSKTVEHFHHIEDVARMLPIHRGYELAAVQLCGFEHGHDYFSSEEILCCLD